MFLVVSNQIIKTKLPEKTEFDFNKSQKDEQKVIHWLISPIIVVGHFRINRDNPPENSIKFIV